MNRQQRRQLERMNKMSRTEALDAIDAQIEKCKELERNGITIKHLEENYDKGYKAGVSDSTSLVTRASYAAAIIALRKEFHFGHDRLLRFLQEMDKQLLECIDHDDLIDRAWQECGLKLIESEPFDRIQDA